MINNSTLLTEAIREHKEQNLLIASEGTIPTELTDLFQDAEEEEFLGDNVDAVNVALKEDVQLDQLLGSLEENAYLASFQTSRRLCTRGRVSKWAGVYSLYNSDVSEDGILEKQMKFIGINVESQFLADLVGIKPQRSEPPEVTNA